MISTELLVLYVVVLGLVLRYLIDFLKTDEASDIASLNYSHVNIDIQSTNEI